MPMYRRRSYRTSVPRKRARYQWVRISQGNVTPVQGPSINTEDLLTNFRNAQGGLLLLLPDIVIWRLHIKISIGFKFLAATTEANSGVHYSIYVDDRLQTSLSTLVDPYSQQFLMWDKMYASESAKQGAFADVVNTTDQHYLYRELDIKSHRKFSNLEQSLMMQIIGTSGVVLTDYDLTGSLLLRVP